MDEGEIPSSFYSFLFLIMKTATIPASMIRALFAKAKTGAQILEVLDVIEATAK